MDRGGPMLTIYGIAMGLWALIAIQPFPMLVATGSFSPKRGLPVVSTLLHSKTFKCSFLNTFRLLFYLLSM